MDVNWSYDRSRKIDDLNEFDNVRKWWCRNVHVTVNVKRAIVRPSNKNKHKISLVKLTWQL